jgi:hypothetical protein
MEYSPVSLVVSLRVIVLPSVRMMVRRTMETCPGVTEPWKTVASPT